MNSASQINRSKRFCRERRARRDSRYDERAAGRAGAHNLAGRPRTDQHNHRGSMRRDLSAGWVAHSCGLARECDSATDTRASNEYVDPED